MKDINMKNTEINIDTAPLNISEIRDYAEYKPDMRPQTIHQNIVMELMFENPTAHKIESMWGMMVDCVNQSGEAFNDEDEEMEVRYFKAYDAWFNIKSFLIPTAKILQLGDEVMEELKEMQMFLYSEMKPIYDALSDSLYIKNMPKLN